MRRGLADGFELDDDPARIDVDEVHRFISEESYWGKGRPRETVERLIREASRVVGLYGDGRQVGFARAVSDGVVFACLADVYVLPEFRGRGLGVELVREMIENGPYARVGKWLLHTDDAHGLYEKFGFEPPRTKAPLAAPPSGRRAVPVHPSELTGRADSTNFETVSTLMERVFPPGT
jgi:GNAT superfamily N-acetyltransferase